MTMNKDKLRGRIESKEPPRPDQVEKIQAYLSKKYQAPVDLTWQAAPDLSQGFILTLGSEVYDWTPKGKLDQLKAQLDQVPLQEGDYLPLLKDKYSSWQPEAKASQRGVVEEVGDSLAVLSGLDHVEYGETIEFSTGTRGMVMDLQKDAVTAIIFGEDDEIYEGSLARRTGKNAGLPVGEGLKGRIINALGTPLDGGEEIIPQDYYPIEYKAPAILDRAPIHRPLHTGILAIDSMFPIGRGQRELIIGDRQTGKTAIALDTIVNQKDQDVLCIYVAIGQKASSVGRLAEELKAQGAMDYTTIVLASAGETAAMQYIAPYAGCAIGEYFMKTGRDVLIIYDDLSKHAVAYRSISLLMGRSPGREAYPGDIFYLHSRLLERSGQLSSEKGGGSMTALPIVETQSGDVSAYVPTNIISITDGQIFLESKLFFAGQRPAVNVGLSVSRVGGAAQTPAMKKASSSLRLDLAQYREMEVFTQFSSDLDADTRALLAYGASLMEILRQEEYKPRSQHKQIISLLVALNHLLTGLDREDIRPALDQVVAYFEREEGLLMEALDRGQGLDETRKAAILEKAKDFLEGLS
ncbi:MAG: F0F1 ATP synthase subunit alpha [Tissierellia bacterium]|nr:F0F1 ATP synthase subunit alpha [Tissierellia bacterium]